MLPESYDIVSEETKSVVQLFMDHANDLLQENGMSAEEPRTILEEIEDIKEEAMDNAVIWAIGDWEQSREPCSAEQFVQRFTALVWEGLVGDDVTTFPYEFTTPVDGVPLAPEFLKAVGVTEEEALADPSKVPASGKTATPTSETSTAPAVPSNPPTQQGEQSNPVHSSSLGKRKHDESETPPRKYGRGDDGQRVPPRSPSPEATHVQWSGVFLTEYEASIMNTNLMNVIWNTRVGGEPKSVLGAGVFQVRIPKDEAWLLLGRDITTVFRLMRQWYPIRLYTYDWGPCLQVGLWIKESQTQGQRGRDMYYTMPDLYRVLWQWSVQTLGNREAVSLAKFLENYLT